MLAWAASCQIMQAEYKPTETRHRHSTGVAAYIKAFLGLNVGRVFNTYVVDQAMQRKVATLEFLHTVCNVPARNNNNIVM